MYYEYFIGRRHLMAPKRNAFVSFITVLSVLGVVIGVMALIIVISVMTGFEEEIQQRILSVESHIVLSRHGGEIHDYDELVSRLESYPEVTSVLPFVMTQVMFRSSYGICGGILRGVPPERAEQIMPIFHEFSPLGEKMVSGGKNEDGVVEAPGIMLGEGLASRLGVSEGGRVYMVLSMGALSPIGHMPAVKRFQVAGVFEAGMHEYDSAFSFAHIEAAQRMLRMQGAVGSIEIRVKNMYEAKNIAKKIVNDLGYPYYAQDWMTMNRNLFEALKLEKIMMSIILTLIILVAAFNIASSLIMIVMNKKKEIGILKAMGARRKSIMSIFVIEGMIVGAVGTIIGVVFGIVSCLLLKRYEFIDLPEDVYYITTLPVQISALNILLISAVALVICFLASLYPASQAAKIDPVEAIRYG